MKNIIKIVVLVVVLAVFGFVLSKSQANDVKNYPPLVLLQNMKSSLNLIGEITPGWGDDLTVDLNVLPYNGKNFFSVKTGKIYTLDYHDTPEPHPYGRVGEYLRQKMGSESEMKGEAQHYYVNEDIICYNRAIYSGQGRFYVWCAEIVYKSGDVPPDTSAWNKYESPEYKFTFKYPPEWKISEIGTSPIASQKRESFAFDTPKPRDTKILFSIVLVPLAEWDNSPPEDSFTELKRNNEYVFAVKLPDHYVIPQEFIREYDRILSTFEI